ncbi:uncharacterized protein LOC129093509 isoform X2 [Anoplopoma fimbria]|uniref:uncharacterized protein LOC129093509 isoform X2 n=1 Tax=Anoplopoma fimbria TaxID=229290 RepID=UPI0023ED0B74|nr:uncharacterized protein LOC129093509 isoform X2 [Anoplopoma fimbria]
MKQQLWREASAKLRALWSQSASRETSGGKRSTWRLNPKLWGSLRLARVCFRSPVWLIIAGSLAVAAQNLHLPTLRACLVMQILACGASIFNLIYCLMKLGHVPMLCWYRYYDVNGTRIEEICQSIQSTQSHLYAEIMVIQAALLAISVTLAVYCCKVVNCCSPAPKMPVITVHTPPVQQ